MNEKDAKYGWYRYDVRFALPVYDDKSGEVCRYNIFFARMRTERNIYMICWQ